MLKKTLFVLMILLMAGSTLLVAEGQKEAAEAYPTTNAQFLIPFGAGGSADVLGRTLADAAEEYFGQPIVAVNKTGAGGGVMYQALKNSKADGYTIGWNSTSVLTVTNIGNVPFGYDAFEHVCRVGYTSMPIAVRSDAPYQTVQEVVDFIKKNPGQMKIGNAGTGSGTHLTAVAFAAAADLDVTHVPLGADRRMPSLLGGEVSAICVPLPEVAPHVQSGDVKILAFPTMKRDEAYPDVPTMQEAGYDVVIELFRGISVPEGTPADRVAVLEEAFKKAAESEKFNDAAKKFGFTVDYMGADEFETYLAQQNELIARSMKLGGLVE